MWENLKDWFKKSFITKYIIVRNELIPWQMIYADRVDIKIILAQSELLATLDVVNGFEFKRLIKSAYLSNGIWSWFIMKILINGNGNNYKYMRVDAGSVLFITDLTGLTEN
jgi:hypothetical protein